MVSGEVRIWEEADTNTFGPEYAGDFCRGWIRTYDPAFVQTPMYGLVGIQIGQDGDLYYLHRNTTSMRRISKS